MPENLTAPTTVPCLMATAPHAVEVRSRALEGLAPDKVRVRTEISMVSTGTELHHIQQTHTRASVFPRMTGYIALGRVVGVGAGVAGVALGQRVLFNVAHLAMADVEPSACTAVPEGIPSADAVCTTLLGIALRGVRAAAVRLGDSVAVFGLGVIGLYAAQLAKLAGACPVIAVDPVERRRALARQAGADATIDPTRQDSTAEIRALTGGAGVRAAIEATATSRVIASLPALTAPQGRIVILGGIHGKVDLDLYTHVQKANLTLVGAGSCYNADWPYDSDAANAQVLLRMMQSGMLRPGLAVTHQAPYTDGPVLYRLLAEQKDQAVGVQFLWPQ